MQENRVGIHDLIWPIFVIDGKNERESVASMPGVERYSIDILVKEVKEAQKLGISAVALFPITPSEKKTDDGKEAANPDNLICQAIKAVKDAVPEVGVITDVALDPFTSHGHDGLLRDGEIVNDETVDILCQQALVQAKAGADVIAPSDMMDGRVGAIRQALDKDGKENVMILSYARKICVLFLRAVSGCCAVFGLPSGRQKNLSDESREQR